MTKCKKCGEEWNWIHQCKQPDEPSLPVDGRVMRVKQVIYEHGGSRLYTENGSGHRNLIVDTYHTKEYALAIREFTEKWLKENA